LQESDQLTGIKTPTSVFPEIVGS